MSAQEPETGGPTDGIPARFRWLSGDDDASLSQTVRGSHRRSGGLTDGPIRRINNRGPGEGPPCPANVRPREDSDRSRTPPRGAPVRAQGAARPGRRGPSATASASAADSDGPGGLSWAGGRGPFAATRVTGKAQGASSAAWERSAAGRGPRCEGAARRGLERAWLDDEVHEWRPSKGEEARSFDLDRRAWARAAAGMAPSGSWNDVACRRLAAARGPAAAHVVDHRDCRRAALLNSTDSERLVRRSWIHGGQVF